MTTSCDAARTPPATTDDLIEHFNRHALAYYRKPIPGRPGQTKPTGEHTALRQATAHLAAVAGSKPPAELVAEDLCAARDHMIDAGLCRSLINRRCNRIRRMIAWATRPPQRWLPVTVLTDFRLIEPLKPNRTPAPEASAIESADWADVSATMAAAPLELATMVEMQWWTGMRPGEVVAMRRSWLLPPDDPHVYQPQAHKCAHYGIPRIVALGPNARGVLLPWLRRLPADQDELWTIRSSSGYSHAVKRVNDRNGLSHWTPLQVRHAFATRIKQAAGIDVAQKLMGHTTPATTRLYLDPTSAVELSRLMDQFG